jgi:hypothetical protein
MDLSKLNRTLKTQKIGVTVQQIGQRLYLQATLPPKPAQSRWVEPKELILNNLDLSQ